MNKIRAWWQTISGILIGLNRRERIFVNSAVVFVALFLLIRFVVVPISGQQGRLEQTLADKKEMLQQMIAIQKEAADVNHKLRDAKTGLDGRDKDFTLFSFLDRLAGEAGVKDAITDMKPSMEESENGSYRLSLVEMKLEAVSLENLVSYIHKIETPQSMVFVKRLSISRQEKDIGGVDAVMQVVTVTG